MNRVVCEKRIQEICVSSTSKVLAALKLFEKKTSNASTWGNFVGELLQGLPDR
jgi:hypothetical protein